MADHRVMPSDKQPGFFYGYAIVMASFFILMIAWGVQYAFGVFFKPVLNEFGWTRAATSGAYSLNMILIAVFGIFAGRISDRFGPRLIVTACGLLLGLGFLLMSQISAIWQMYLFYGVLISVGIAGMWVPLLSALARWFVRGRGLVSGIAASGISVGIIIIPLLANQLISSYGWRTSYVIIGLIALVVIVISAQFLRRDPGQMGLTAHGADSASMNSLNLPVRGNSVREAIRTRPFWMLSAMFFFTNFAIHTVTVHIVPHATDIGISAVAAATILSVFGFISIGSKVGMGILGDKIGNRQMLIIVFALMLVAFFWLELSRELWMFYVFAAVFAISYGGSGAVQSPIVAEFFEMKAHGAILGLAVFGANIGGAIGSLLAGRIFDVTGSYYWAFIICALISVAGLVLSIMLKSPGKQLAVKPGYGAASNLSNTDALNTSASE